MALITVSNANELSKAIATANGGDKIVLQTGEYGDVLIKNRNFSSTVTIVAAAGADANIGTLNVAGSSNVSFRDLDFSSALTPGGSATTYNAIAKVTGSSSIAFDNVHIHGSLDKDPGNDRYGLSVVSSTNVSVTNSEFQQLGRAAVFDRSTGLTVSGNDFHDLRSDGADFVAVTNVVIDSNRFTDFVAAKGDHPDAIQFWTTGSNTASSNIRITNNQMLQGSGTGMQGIFMRDEVSTLPFSNVLISNNLVYGNAMPNGISVQGGRDVTITNNNVMSPVADDQQTFIRVAKVAGGTVANNVSDSLISADNSGIATGGNLWLTSDVTQSLRIADINRGSAASAGGLTMSGNGYQIAGIGTAIDRTPGSKFTALTVKTPVEAVKSTVLLDLSFEGGVVADRSSYASALAKAGDATAIKQTENGAVYQLTGNNGFEVASRTALQLYALDKFTLSFSLQRDHATQGAGYFMSLGGAWNLALSSNGSLVMTNTNGGTTQKITSSIKITDVANHDIDISYDGAKNVATLYIDGKSAGTMAVSGATSKDVGRNGLYVGYLSGTSAKVSLGEVTMRSVSLNATEIAAENLSGRLLYAGAGLPGLSAGLPSLSDSLLSSYAPAGTAGSIAPGAIADPLATANLTSFNLVHA